MKAILLTDLRKLELREVPEPIMRRSTDVRLKIERVGVCGSDVHYFETGAIGSRRVEYPFALGHECAATVLEVGPGVKRVRAGDAVAVDPAMACHDCDQCRQGRENTCRHLTFLGCPGQAPGCLSERLVMPEDCLYPLPKGVSLDQGVLCEPLSIGFYAVRQSGAPAGAEVGVLGAGPIGLSVFLAARQAGADRVYMTDKLDYRVQRARDAGAAWAGNPEREDVVKVMGGYQPTGLDVVYECAGQPESLDQAVELLKPGGKLMLVGIPRTERISFHIDRLRRKELTIINVRRQNGCVQTALDWVAANARTVDFMVTHHFPPEEAQAAFDTVAGYKDWVLKAMIDFT